MKNKDKDLLRVGVSAGVLTGVLASIIIEIMTRLLIQPNEGTGLGVLWTVIALLLFVAIVTGLEFLIVRILEKLHDKRKDVRL